MKSTVRRTLTAAWLCALAALVCQPARTQPAPATLLIGNATAGDTQAAVNEKLAELFISTIDYFKSRLGT